MNKNSISNNSEMFWRGKDKILTCDIDSLKFVTPHKTADIMFALINRKAKKLVGDRQLSLLNMTGNFGGDTLPFLATYDVTVYEIDKDICDGLSHNVKQYKPRKCEVVQGDATLHLKYTDTVYDVILCDPPFGDEYHNKDIKYQPRIGEYNMSELVVAFHDRAKLFALKLPQHNFDIQGFKESVAPLGLKIDYYTPQQLRKVDPKHRSHKISLLLAYQK